MSFTVSAQGVARKQRYVMGSKKLADPGNVVEGFELLQKLADTAKLPMSGMDEHYKMSVDIWPETELRVMDDELGPNAASLWMTIRE